jgi:uncharacterized protein DUF222
VGEMQSSLDALAAEDLKPLFAPAVLDRLRELLVVQNRIAAEIARTVRQCELAGAAEHDGLKTMAGWLRGHARLSAAAAARVVAGGRAVEHLPQLAAAFAEGVVTAEQMAVVAPAVTAERRAAAVEQGVNSAEVDAALVTVATTQPYPRLGEVVHRYLDALDPDGPEPDPIEARRFTMTRHADGSGSGNFDLDAIGMEKVQAVIESMVQAARPAGDMRTRAQQQADALVQWADNTLAAGSLPTLRTVKPHVIVTINAEDLVDTTSTGPGAARTGFGATISAARARWLTCDATISRMVLGPDGLPLDVGRTQRVVPAHIRRAVEQRDGHCVFAGCYAPTHWCEVHHPATPRGPRRACESWGGSGPYTYEGPSRVPDRTR